MAQLLKTRRFKLKGNFLIQVDTNDSIEIDPYVIKRLDLQEVNKLSEFDNLNEKVMQLVRSGVDVKEKFNEFRKSTVNFTQQVTKSPQKTQKLGKKSVHGKILPYIKGLKEFKLKML